MCKLRTSKLGLIRIQHKIHLRKISARYLHWSERKHNSKFGFWLKMNRFLKPNCDKVSLEQSYQISWSHRKAAKRPSNVFVQHPPITVEILPQRWKFLGVAERQHTLTCGNFDREKSKLWLTNNSQCLANTSPW